MSDAGQSNVSSDAGQADVSPDSSGQTQAPLENTTKAGEAATPQSEVVEKPPASIFEPMEPPKNFGVKTPSNKDGHTCGTGCGHDHSHNHNHTQNSSSGGGYYYHVDKPPVHPQEPELPKNKSKAGWWALGIIAAAGVGAYLLNGDGKAKKKASTPKPADWKERAEQSTAAESRGL